MRRIYFLAPNIESTSSIVNELKQNNIEDKYIHVVGKDHHKLQEAHIHEANILQTTDFVKALEKGAVAGGTAGILAGLAAVTFPPAGLILGGGAILGLGLFGTGFGAWVSSMIGISIPDQIVGKFEDAIESGELLMIIDVKKADEDKIKQLIKEHHPEALIDGIDLKVK